MTHLFALALRSAWNRRWTLGLTLTAIVLSVALLLAVERLRHDAREMFAQSVSGTDLVVGARSGPVQLMLYAVFRLGGITQGFGWESYRELARHPQVAWAIPLSLGDSHRGFPVVGTDAAYFEHFRFGERQPLRLAQGRPFDALFDAVLGADAAAQLGYRLGDRIVLSHGTGDIAHLEHGDRPFTVVGILARTGTPVDRSVHVSLQAVEAIHLEWQGGAPMPGLSIPQEHLRKFDLTPRQITAALVGLKSRTAVFAVQREINQHRGEPLMAVLPGVALDELWEAVGMAEQALRAVSALVVAVGLAGLVAVMLAGLNERRRELAVLRAVGAQPRELFGLLAIEGFGLSLAGVAGGLGLLWLVAWLLDPWIRAQFGVGLPWRLASPAELKLLGAVLLAGTLASLIPAWRAYRHALADGLTPRI